MRQSMIRFSMATEICYGFSSIRTVRQHTRLSSELSSRCRLFFGAYKLASNGVEVLSAEYIGI